MIARRPAVAGSFYPAQPDRLRREVVELLADAEAALKTSPKALIAPHAGYIYSGSLAAAAFATLRDTAQTWARVVLIGPPNYIPTGGLPLPPFDPLEPPPGRVRVNYDP